MKYISIVGSRKLPYHFRFHTRLPCKARRCGQVREVVSYILGKGWYINSGGVIGADSYALSSLLRYGKSYIGVIYSAWNSISNFPFSVKKQVGEFYKKGGKIIWGEVSEDSSRKEVVSGLLRRNKKLVENSDLIIAYFYGESRGTTYTIKEAIKNNIPVLAFVCDKYAKLPDNNWRPINSNHSLIKGYFLEPKEQIKTIPIIYRINACKKILENNFALVH